MESVSIDIAGFQMGSFVAFISLVLDHAFMMHWCGAMSCEVPVINNKVIWDWYTWGFQNWQLGLLCLSQSLSEGNRACSTFSMEATVAKWPQSYLCIKQ